MQAIELKSNHSRQTSSTGKSITDNKNKFSIPSANNFITGVSLLRSSLNSSPRNNDSSLVKNIKRRSHTQNDIELPQINTSPLTSLVAQKNQRFLKKKIFDIHKTSIQKISKIYQTELTLNTEPSTPLSSSKQNLTKSVLKRLSSKLSQNKQIKNKQKIFRRGEIGIQMNKIFHVEKMNFLSPQIKLTGQKIRESFQAYAKTQNQRIMRLIQKQEQLELKFSSIKKNLKIQAQKDKRYRLSKKDFYLYSKSLANRAQVK